MKVALPLFKRSVWKGPYIVPLPIGNALKTGNPIRTNARSCTIIPQFVGVKFQVHNGKEYVPISITQEMVGFKLGEFVPTRKKFKYNLTKN
ncbi:mitochondrial 37S ribosomal protein uS19m [Ascoidea rubescens DSM 1968]|uniref:Small ribosomal subunit protein uS19m n=1 Tax=Ascoidea rubescens DSM 1968 TaxID=1344418 RepID=A0A1D2V891_9ASCO|nr:ribosomal protein S19/S15 [Ascoidea rubescens DSM 1968]ODV57849.1 ribosomal protein S19/S15 [Ascoidea rubescens DSM 1968]